ncbi:MAG TPA: ABC transporter permease [Alphaproteobacteria bacterium]|nr:ABC transporter permease [Alphaproteobacteria bacterium]
MTSAALAQPDESAPSLRRRLALAERKRQLAAVGLVLPLFLFILISFILPIGQMLWYSVRDQPPVAELLPRTAVEIAGWDGADLPAESVYAALTEDLKQAQAAKLVAQIGKRLNYEISGIRSQVLMTGRAVTKLENGPYKDALIGINKVWADRKTWSVIKRSVRPVTDYYLLAAVDLERDADGRIARTSADQAIYIDVLLRTLEISAAVTILTLLLGFPLAYLLASLPTGKGNLLMIMVLLPFWTSLLVRTTAWVVLLQGEGVINSALAWIGIIDHPLELIFNRGGTIVAMTHIQLPFTLLPIYSVMKTISPAYVRAARSLGAAPFLAFWRVYFPQTVPGIAAGCLLTFILSMGYYITPALVGGPADQMMSYFVALFINREINWGMASALGAVLLLVTLLLYFVYNKLVGIDRMKLA